MSNEPVHNPRKNHLKDLVLLFSIPIGIILLLITFLYVPRLLANPSYDFVYCEGYECDTKFAVSSNGKLEMMPIENERYSYRDNARLYIYDVKRDASRPLQFDTATGYTLDATSKSPDGYTLQYDSGNSGFLFWGSSTRGSSLKNGFASRSIVLNSNYGDSKFIGWVVKQ